MNHLNRRDVRHRAWKEALGVRRPASLRCCCKASERFWPCKMAWMAKDLSIPLKKKKRAMPDKRQIAAHRLAKELRIGCGTVQEQASQHLLQRPRRDAGGHGQAQGRGRREVPWEAGLQVCPKAGQHCAACHGSVVA